MQSAHRVNAANDLAANVGGIRFADVSQRRGIAEDRQGLLKFGEIRGAEQHCCLATVASNHDPIVFALDSIDDL
jgi:hypothetical protein